MSEERESAAPRREAGELTPDNGARFVFELVDGARSGARYRVRIERRAAGSSEPEESMTVATIAGGAKVTLDTWTNAPEAWALETVLGVCRTLSKNHAEAGDWPGVLRRWRAPRE